MSAAPDSPRDRPAASRDGWVLLASACLALIPYLAHLGIFSRLFWFGDEFDLIDQMNRLGFWHWVWLVFAENFVPVFKVLWGGGVLLFGGSYAAVICAVWLLHALNVWLLGRLMRACELPWAAVFFAQAAFGLTSGNIETLAWSVQGSAVLSVTFMLLALLGFLNAPARPASYAWSAASALSFSRGVLTGPVLACASLCAGDARRLVRAACYLVPSVIVALLILGLATGNQQHMGGHWADAAAFGSWCYCLNPLYLLLGFESWGWRTFIVLGLLKISLVAWSLARSGGRLRLLFAMLVALDLGNAVLLGIGRYHTGLASVVSSRYQYAALICLAPLGGYWFSRLCERVRRPALVRYALAPVLLIIFAAALCRQWSGALEPFTAQRGSESRRILFAEAAPAADSVPGIPGLPMDRAKALITKYHLH
jgi:hypothetical protein